MQRNSRQFVLNISILLLIQSTAVLADEDFQGDVNEETYTSFIKDFETLATHGVESKQNVLLQITLVLDDRPYKDPIRRLLSGRTLRGVTVWENGGTHLFACYPQSIKGSSNEDVPATDLKRLSRLLKLLPDDKKWLPPYDRKVVLQIPQRDSNKVDVRVYDRANLPDQVWEVIRLSQYGIQSWVPTFGAIRIHDPNHQQLTLLATGQTTVEKAKATNPDERSYRSEKYTLSPNRKWAVVDNGLSVSVYRCADEKRVLSHMEPFRKTSLSSTRTVGFSANSKWLMLLTSQQEPRFYETKNWKLRKTTPDIPDGIVEFYPSRDGKYAVVETATHDINVWDAKKREMKQSLAKNSRLNCAAFSSDTNSVVIATAHLHRDKPTGSKIEIFDVKSGKKRQQLILDGREYRNGVTHVFWQSEKYLLVTFSSDTFFSSKQIAVWNIESKRIVGLLTGCHGKFSCVVLPSDGKNVIAADQQNETMIWDLKKALAEISEFEKSLSATNPR